MLKYETRCFSVETIGVDDAIDNWLNSFGKEDTSNAHVDGYVQHGGTIVITVSFLDHRNWTGK